MPLSNLQYVIFALLTLLLGPCMVFGLFLFWYAFPIHVALTTGLRCFVPVVRLLGREPTLNKPSPDALVWLLVCWPLTLAPIHFLSFRVLDWPDWACGVMMSASFVVIAIVSIYITSWPRPRRLR